MNRCTSTPHPVPDQQRLANRRDETLGDLIVLVEGRRVFAARLRQAGIPILWTLKVEQRRRERTRQAAAS